MVPFNVLVKLALTAAELRRATRAMNHEPTPGQAAAGNYRKGHIAYKSLDITVETAAGQYRRGKDWEVKLIYPYGYIKRTEGKDGDHVDVILCTDHLESDLVHVVHQKKRDGSWDEHKVLLGCRNIEEAKKAYLSNYAPGWKGMGRIVPMTLEQFRHWLDEGDTTKEIPDEWFKGRRKAAAYFCETCKTAFADAPAAGKCPQCSGDAVPDTPELRAKYAKGPNPAQDTSVDPKTASEPSPDSDGLKRLQDALNNCSDEELDGIYVYYNTHEPHQVWIDLADWADESVARDKLKSPAAHAAGDEARVIWQNEKGPNLAAGWIEVEPARSKQAAPQVTYSDWLDKAEDEPLYRFDAHADGKNVGYLTSHPGTDGDYTWLKGLKVDPTFRGQGVARRLLENALRHYAGQELRLRARPYEDAPLTADQLKTFYARYGFRGYDAEDRMVRRPRAKEAALDLEKLSQRLVQTIAQLPKEKQADDTTGIPSRADLGVPGRPSSWQLASLVG